MNGGKQQDPKAAGVAALLATFQKLEAGGAAKTDHPEHEKRNEVLDELQSAVGLEGRMVMERDIIKRAERILAGG